MINITNIMVTNIDAYAFIVPNAIQSVDGTDMVHIWLWNPESDNFSDHGVTKRALNGEGIYFAPGAFGTMFPVECFKGEHEGDTVTLRVITRGRDTSSGKEENYKVILKLTLDQLSSRYDFGPFEEVLEQLLTK